MLADENKLEKFLISTGTTTCMYAESGIMVPRSSKMVRWVSGVS